MRKRCFNAALAGAIAASIAFTAVPAQIIFASGANAQAEAVKVSGTQNDVYWFRNPEGSSKHCKVNVWGHMLDC